MSPLARGRRGRTTAVAALALSLGVPLPAAAAQAAPGARTARQGAAPTAPVSHALTLEEAVRLAERASESLRIAEAGALRARGQVVQARSAYLPQLNGTLAYQRALANQFQEIVERNPPPADTSGGGGGGGGNNLGAVSQIFASENTVILGVTGSQTLFAGGRVLAQNRMAQAGRRAAEIGVRTAKAQLSYDVAQAYLDAAAADRMVAIADSSLAQTERVVRQATLAREVGSTSEFEYLRARVARDNQRPATIAARTQRDVAYLRLKQLLQLPARDTLVLTTRLDEGAASAGAAGGAGVTAGGVPVTTAQRTPELSSAEVEERIAEATRTALQRADTSIAGRAAVQQVEEGVNAQREALRIARAQRLPSVAVQTNYQRFAYPSNADVLPRAWNRTYPNWTLTLGVSVPIFTGFRIRGDELVAKANLTEAEQRHAQARELAALEAELAVAQLEQAQAAWLGSVGTDEQASRAYRIAEVRFAEGISTQLELAESRILLQQARANRIVAARDVELARIRLALIKELPLGGASGMMGGPQGAPQGMGGAAAGGAPMPPGGAPRGGAPQGAGSQQIGGAQAAAQQAP